MLICKPKFAVAQQGFLPPIWGYHPLWTTCATKGSYRHQGGLRNNFTVAAWYITTSRGTLLASRGAKCIERNLGQKSSHSRPHNSSKGSRRYFSDSPRNMTAEKIDGTAIAKGIRARLQGEIKKRQETNPRYKPSLTIVQVGDKSDSSTYVRMKLKAAEEVKTSNTQSETAEPCLMSCI